MAGENIGGTEYTQIYIVFLNLCIDGNFSPTTDPYSGKVLVSFPNLFFMIQYNQMVPVSLIK